jgi:hypothetical protein
MFVAHDRSREVRTLTNEALPNDANQCILTVVAHGRDMKISDHEIVKFVLEMNVRRSMPDDKRGTCSTCLTRSGISGRMFVGLLFDVDSVRDESSPQLLPSSNVPDRSLLVSFI